MTTNPLNLLSMYHAMCEASPDAIGLLNSEGTFEFLNARAARFLDQIAPTLIGSNQADFFAPEIAAEHQKLIQRVLHENAAIQFEKCYPTESGPFCISVRLVPICNPAGQPVSVMALAQDITQARAREEERARLWRQISLLLESSGEGIYGLDLNGCCTFINRAAMELIGCSREEAIGQKIHEFLHHHRPDGSDYPVDDCPLLRAFRDGTQCRSDSEFFWRKDGTMFPVAYSSFPVIDCGQLTGAVVTFSDITQRKQIEQTLADQTAELLAQRHLLETLIDHLPDAVTVKDDQLRYLHSNKTHLQLIGAKSREEILGKKLSDFFPPSITNPFDAEDRALIQSGQSLHDQERDFPNQKGKKLLYLYTKVPLMNGSGHARGLVIIARDITEKKQAEALILRNQRLENIGALASGIAHDLNNILAPILMSLQILHLKYNHPDDQRLLTTIKSSAQRGAELVRQVLTFARGPLGERAPLQLRHIVSEISQVLSETLPKSIQIRRFTPADLWSVHASPTQLHQVLMNLAVNARDAMPNGGVLTLEGKNILIDEQFAAMQPGAKPGPYVVLRVTDTGTGIEAGICHRIFEPFFTTKPPDQGTGLGLATVRKIVDDHGGFITLTSEIGHGSEFAVHLPAQTVGIVSPEASVELLPPLSAGHGEIVLVVDDEESILTIAQQTLESFGYHVLTARDGVAAISAVSQQPSAIDLLLTDLMMPNIDGMTAIRVIRAINPKIRIIVASGWENFTSDPSIADLQPDALLPKPFTAEQMLRAVQSALSSNAKT